MSAVAPGRPASGSPADPLLLAAGAAYVAAWLGGLVAAPSRPTGVTPSALGTFVNENAASLVTQSLLVHGVAGVALAVVVLRAHRHLRTRAGLGAGLAAALLSLVQVGALVAAVIAAGRGADAGVARLLATVDILDAAKLIALAAFVVATALSGRRLSALPAWLSILGAVLGTVLVVGAASFAPPAQVLSVALFVALPALLVYVGGIAVILSRQRSGDRARAVL